MQKDSKQRVLSRWGALASLLALVLPALAPAQEVNPFAEHIRSTDPLTPEDERQAFLLPTGFEVQLVAAEPDILKPMKLHANRFGIEPEITAKLFKAGARVYEVPITYDGRDYSEGKKITWKDGFPALWTLIKYRFVD